MNQLRAAQFAGKHNSYSPVNAGGIMANVSIRRKK